MAGPIVARSKGTSPEKVQKRSKQKHGLASILTDAAEGKVTISALYLALAFVMAGFGGQFFVRKLIDFLSRASIIIYFLSGFIFTGALIMGSMVEDYTVVLKKLKKKATTLFQSKHEHNYELKNFDTRFTCNECKEEGFSSTYRCEQCDYNRHHYCMFPKQTVSHELCKESFEFSDKRLIPTSGDMISCDACGNEIHGYFYHCKAENLSLHPWCINLKSKLCMLGSTFSLKNKASSKCFWCNVNSKKGVNSGWSYVSECKNYQFHVKCIVPMLHEAWKIKEAWKKNGG